MKLCVLNFSGNVGKSTIAAHLFEPRLRAPVISVESLNQDATSDGVQVERLRARQFGELQNRLLRFDQAIVDVGSSNVEEFLKLMQRFDGSHEEFDLFVVPVVKDAKQQIDTVNTIRALRTIGVPASKIRVLINKADTDDDVREDFSAVFGFCLTGEASVSERSVIFANEVFELLKHRGLSLGALNADTTDYRARLRDASSDEERDDAISMIAMKRLAISCTRNLDAAFEAVMAR